MKEKESFFLILIGFLVYPLWLLFAWAVNLVSNISGTRNANGGVETPVVFYRHPETKRRIVFIATIHLAETEYFTELQKLIESLSGYQILFEGIGKLSPQERQALTRKERGVIRHFNYLNRAIVKIGEIISLQYQKEGLPHRPDWINIDVRMYDFARLFVQHNIRPFSRFKKKKNSDDLSNEDESTQMLIRWLMDKLFCQLNTVAVIFNILSFFSRDKRLIKKFTIEFRNQEAIRGIDTHLKGKDVVIIWGAGHLRGIERWIKQAGFHETRRIWFTAYHVRGYSLFRCLRRMITTRSKN